MAVHLGSRKELRHNQARRVSVSQRRLTEVGASTTIKQKASQPIHTRLVAVHTIDLSP